MINTRSDVLACDCVFIEGVFFSLSLFLVDKSAHSDLHVTSHSVTHSHLQFMTPVTVLIVM
jgi:hypothetical protein